MKKAVTFRDLVEFTHGYLRFYLASNFDVVVGGGESNLVVSLSNYGIPALKGLK